jgi:sialidase-1
MCAATQLPERQDIFVPSARYPCFRQPIIVTSNPERTHILAFAENRNVSACDPAATMSPSIGEPLEVGSLLLRRSTDSGKTWLPMQSLYFRPGLNIDFLTAVVDKQKGRVWLVVREPKSLTMFTSDDEGASWSEPKAMPNITSWSPDISSKSLKPGCAHGMQVEKGLCGGGDCKEAGRLVLPFVCVNTSASGSHSDKGCTTCLACNIYSDDAGISWNLGGVGQPGTRESQLAQVWSKTSSTELYINERNMGKTPGHRMYARSNDGGETYSPSTFGVDRTLTAPVTSHWTGIVAGTSRLLAPNSTGNGGALAFSAPGSTTARANMTLRVSRDEGRTWSAAKTAWAGPAGYSDLTWVGDDSVAMIFENGDTGFAERVSVQIFPSTWFQ